MQNEKTERENNNAQTSRFNKRIGSVTYEVSVHFKTDAKETMEGKILRLIKNDMEAVS